MRLTLHLGMVAVAKWRETRRRLMLSNPSNTCVRMARAATLGSPWLVVVGFSATIAWALNSALTGLVPTAHEATEPEPTVIARPAGSQACGDGAWMVYVGQGTWIPDPRRPCLLEASATDR
jgi:hypothetical protein